MPIKAHLRRFYRGQDWEETRQAVLERAGHRCECTGHCGEMHGLEGRCTKRHHQVLLDGRRIVLATAHLNRVPGDDRPENLRAFCNRCHLLFDHPVHKVSRKATLRARKRPSLELPL